MKKLLSICLTVVMMVSLLAGFAVNAAGAEYYTLRRENFGIEKGQASSTGWSTQNIDGDVQNNGGFKMNPSAIDYGYGLLACAKAANVPITAKFYVDTPGAYTAFMHVTQHGAGFKFAIDGQETTTLFGSTLNETGNTVMTCLMVTEKADRTWQLEAGWHTVTITATQVGNSRLGSFETVYITNNTSLETTGLTYVCGDTNATVDSKVNMAVYEDFTAPTISSFVGTADANTANEHRTSATLTWAATDASGIAKYEVYNGTEWVDVTNETSYTVNDLWSASDYTFKLRVTDYFGYTAETTASVTTNGPTDTEGPSWPAAAELTVDNKTFSAIITWPEATDNRGLAGYEIREGAADGTLLATVTEGRTYTVAINPGDEKDIYVIAKDLSGYTSTALDTTVTSGAATENFTLREGNFELSSWSLVNISSNMRGLGCPSLNLGTATNQATVGQALQSKAASAVATANIYVDTPGEYVLFAQLLSGHKVKAAVGNGAYSGYIAETPVMNNGQKTYVWAKADKVWNLEAGWNTVKLLAEDTGAMVAAVYITKGVNVEANEVTYISGSTTLVSEGKLNVARYEDTEGPTFAEGEVTVAYDTTANAATITWPAATDEDYVRETYTMPASALQSYKIYVNNKEISEEDNATTSFTIDETALGRALVSGETLNIKVAALDIFGNATEKTLSYEVSKFVISSFDITGTTAQLVIKNVSEAAADVRLSIAIYDATGDLVAGNYVVNTVAADGADDTVTASITSGAPADLTGYTVKAHLWNADLSPVSANWPTIVINQ